MGAALWEECGRKSSKAVRMAQEIDAEPMLRGQMAGHRAPLRTCDCFGMVWHGRDELAWREAGN